MRCYAARGSWVGSRSEDHCRSIVVEVLAALRAGDFARLERYAEARRDSPTLPFLAWLAVVAKRIAIDYMRRQDEYVDLRRAPEAIAKGAWVNLVTLPPDSELGGARPRVTEQALAREILAFAGDNLEPEQSRALERWTQGASFDEIATAMSLPGAKDAERLVRAAIERLRRHFRTGGSRWPPASAPRRSSRHRVAGGGVPPGAGCGRGGGGDAGVEARRVAEAQRDATNHGLAELWSSGGDRSSSPGTLCGHWRC